MEGDCRELAGLKEGEGAFGFYLHEAAKKPGFFLLNILKRLWHIFLFSPPLFGLFLLAMAITRSRDKLLAFGLPVYFILIHAALSIEDRYFYPLIYLLPPLLTGSLWPWRTDLNQAQRVAAEKATNAVLLACFCAVSVIEAVITVYPYRAAHNINDREYLDRVLNRFREDRVFQEMKCKVAWTRGDDSGYYACLASYNKKFDDPVYAYFLAAEASNTPATLPFPPIWKMECLTIRMLRELELGDRNAATNTYTQVSSEFKKNRTMLRGEPYQKDKELALLIKQNSSLFRDEYLPSFLIRLPSKSIPGVITGLKTITKLPAGSKVSMLAEVLSLGEVGERMLRKRVASDMSGTPSRLPNGGMSLLWKEEAAETKRLSDAAVKNMIAGNLNEAEAYLLKAVELNPAGPEAFMNLCSIYRKENKTAKALEACKSAAYAVYFNPENMRPALTTLAAEASFESSKLLTAAGRTAEARTILSRALDNAPAEWPGLANAKAAYNKLK